MVIYYFKPENLILEFKIPMTLVLIYLTIKLLFYYLLVHVFKSRVSNICQYINTVLVISLFATAVTSVIRNILLRKEVLYENIILKIMWVYSEIEKMARLSYFKDRENLSNRHIG